LIHPRGRSTPRRRRIPLQATRTSWNRRWATRRHARLRRHGREARTGRWNREVREASWPWRRNCALRHVRQWRGETACWRGTGGVREWWREWKTVGSWGLRRKFVSWEWLGGGGSLSLGSGDIGWNGVRHTRKDAWSTGGTGWRDAEWGRRHAGAAWMC